MRSAGNWAEGIPLIAHVSVFVGLVGVSLIGAADNWYFALACVSVVGFCGTMIGINMQSAIQLTVDESYRGRVVGLGALLLGGLTDLFGLSATLISAGLIGIVVVVGIRYALSRALRSR